MTHFILRADLGEQFCSIFDESKDWDDDTWYPSEGMRMGSLYPRKVTFRMTAEVPGLELGDYISNAHGYPMVTGRMRAVLEDQATADIEYLPFTLLDHKRRAVKEACAIANVIGTVDCVDRKRTEGVEDPVKKGRLMILKKLFLDDARVDPKRNLFRIATRPRVLIVRDDLRAALERAGLKGLLFLDLGAPIHLQ